MASLALGSPSLSVGPHRSSSSGRRNGPLRYASLFFVACIDQDDNELITLEKIHLFVEVLDRYFGNVCELDIIFNFHKAYYILDELFIGGELQARTPIDPSCRRVILRPIQRGPVRLRPPPPLLHPFNKTRSRPALPGASRKTKTWVMPPPFPQPRRRESLRPWLLTCLAKCTKHPAPSLTKEG